MATNLRNKWSFTNLFLKGAELEVNHKFTNIVAGAAVRKAVALPNVLELRIPTSHYTITDDGTNGAYLSVELFTFPLTDIHIHDAYLYLNILNVGVDIGQFATVNVAVGTSANVNHTLSGTELNIVPLVSPALVGSAVTTSSLTTTVTRIDARSATKAYLNFGIAAADSTPNSDPLKVDLRISFQAYLRMTYLDMTGGR